MDCIFCKIANGIIPSNKVYEDNDMLAFHDINPQAPVHMLVLPKKHVASVAATTDEDQALLGHMMRVAAKMAEERGIAESGYRLIVNTGRDGAQTVMHLHLHVLGGKALTEQMA